MARVKKGSLDYEKGIKRLAAMKSISSQLDLGNGLTTDAYSTEIDSVKQKLEIYNSALSVADGTLNDLKAQEAILRDWNERMLTGIATKYGKDSSEYEKAGGTKKSDTKKRKSAARTVSATA